MIIRILTTSDLATSVRLVIVHRLTTPDRIGNQCTVDLATSVRLVIVRILTTSGRFGNQCTVDLATSVRLVIVRILTTPDRFGKQCTVEAFNDASAASEQVVKFVVLERRAQFGDVREREVVEPPRLLRRQNTPSGRPPPVQPRRSPTEEATCTMARRTKLLSRVRRKGNGQGPA